jgi:hypothetical protein
VIPSLLKISLIKIYQKSIILVFLFLFSYRKVIQTICGDTNDQRRLQRLERIRLDRFKNETVGKKGRYRFRLNARKMAWMTKHFSSLFSVSGMDFF